ncbi:MAG: hypothetical protein GY765_39630, partial [bacterium]|nr:hypothetical protein [bacterium]
MGLHNNNRFVKWSRKHLKGAAQGTDKSPIAAFLDTAIKKRAGVILFLFLTLLLIPFIIPASASEAGEKAPPKYEIPSTVFKGKILKLKDIGDYDKIFLDGHELLSETIKIQETGEKEIRIIKDGKTYTFTFYSISGWLTLLPPVVAIALALIFKDVIVALFVGIFTGALFLNKFDIVVSFFHVVDTYILNAFADKERGSIIMFTLLLGGMVGIISKTGGVKGIVNQLSRKVSSPCSTQFYTW